MIFDFFKKNKEKISLMVDIGNGSIAGAFVLFKKDVIPELLFSIRLPFVVAENPTSENLTVGMYALLNEMLETIMKRGFSHKYFQTHKKKLYGVLVTFSSPWFVSKTKHLHMEQDRTFIITKPFLEDVMKKEEKVFETELADKLGPNIDPYETIEKSLIHTKINGYTLDDSIDRKTKVFDAFVHLSIIHRSIADKVASLILKHTHISKERILMHTFPIVSFSTIRDLFMEVSDFIIMDITGEVTDMTLVKDNVIAQTISFPSGRNFIIRQIAKAFSTSPEVAESTLHIHMLKKSGDLVYNRLAEIFNSMEQEWSGYLEKTIQELSLEFALPSKVYLTSDGDVAQIFMDFLKLPKEDSTSVFRKNINVTLINHNILSDLYKSDGVKLEDEFIGILSIFYNKMTG